jgi:hypothetical protein
LKLLAYFYNKTYAIGYGAGKLLIDLGIEKWKLQGIGFYREVEDISINSYKELKAAR